MFRLDLDYRGKNYTLAVDQSNQECSQFILGRQNEAKQGVNLLPGFAKFARNSINTRFGYNDLFRELGIVRPSGDFVGFSPCYKAKVIPPEVCDELVAIIESDCKATDDLGLILSSKKTSTSAAIFSYVANSILGSFRSEFSSFYSGSFSPISFMAWKTRGMDLKNSTKNCSYRWHTDGVPSYYLKVLVYLSECADSGGGTEIYGAQANKIFDDIGYAMLPIKDRKTDLTQLLSQHGSDDIPESYVPEKGSAVLLLPSENLHKGVAPSLGKNRYALQISFIPFPVYYQQDEKTVNNFCVRSFGCSYPVVNVVSQSNIVEA